MQKKKVYSLLNLFLKFNYIALIHKRLMAIYRVYIRCSRTVSAQRKFLWKNATSFTGELVCSVHLSFDSFSPATAQDCQDESLAQQRCQPHPCLGGSCQGPSLALSAPGALPAIWFPWPCSSSWDHGDNFFVLRAHTSRFSGHTKMLGDTALS